MARGSQWRHFKLVDSTKGEKTVSSPKEFCVPHYSNPNNLDGLLPIRSRASSPLTGVVVQTADQYVTETPIAMKDR